MNPISRSTEYAVRALTYLAQQRGDGRYHLAREMADKLGIPAPFLGKILQPLVTREVLESQRGRNGGFRLALEPKDVPLARIAESQETNRGPRGCLLGQAECSDERACPMHEYWKVAADAFEAKMEKTTLADLVAFCENKPQSGYPCGTPEPGKVSVF
ncbi:MAG: Rrf2 family transcriptional regulator [Planctomycetes bacterium]|nr:Rrf2 family transcriptional regulator [Planctomycetota bacterium]